MGGRDASVVGYLLLLKPLGRRELVISTLGALVFALESLLCWTVSIRRIPFKSSIAMGSRFWCVANLGDLMGGEKSCEVGGPLR